MKNLMEDWVKRPIWKFLKINLIADTVQANDMWARGRIKKLESLVQVGVDVHMKGESWAVVCIAGKPEYVQFRRLHGKDAMYLLELLKKLEQQYGRVIVDAPIGLRDYLDNLR